MITDFILEEAKVLVREGRFVWESYNHDRVRKVFILIRELSFPNSAAFNWLKSDKDSIKIYTIIKNFESHVLYLITELLNSIKMIPDIVYQKKIAVIRSYLNLLIISRENKITPIPDGIPLMVYWDPFNKRLWKVIVSSSVYSPNGFTIQTLIENDKDRNDAIRNLQEERVLHTHAHGNLLTSTLRNRLYKKEIELLNRENINNTFLFKVTQQ